jgi:ABC-2 type transport system permease protein
MRNAPPIFVREIKAYFVSPIAYVALIVFVLLSGYFFAAYFNWASRYQGEASMRVTIHNISITMLLVVPLITMRLFSEEKRSGTIEILMTSPVTDAEAVLGKFAAGLALFAIMLLLTFTCPLFLVIYSTGTPDIAPIAVGYLGLFLLGIACLSLGVVTSAITKNQIVAALISFSILLGLWIINWTSGSVGGLWGKALSFVSLVEHFEDFAKGILDTKHVVYYVSFASFCLFLAIKLVQSAKWR